MTVNNAIKWLQNHYVEVLGTTDNGVCVVEELSHNGVGYSQTVWLPADINVLRDWMGY